MSLSSQKTHTILLLNVWSNAPRPVFDYDYEYRNTYFHSKLTLQHRFVWSAVHYILVINVHSPNLPHFRKKMSHACKEEKWKEKTTTKKNPQNQQKPKIQQKPNQNKSKPNKKTQQKPSWPCPGSLARQCWSWICPLISRSLGKKNIRCIMMMKSEEQGLQRVPCWLLSLQHSSGQLNWQIQG